jgi:hypothetical protein
LIRNVGAGHGQLEVKYWVVEIAVSGRYHKKEQNGGGGREGDRERGKVKGTLPRVR